MMDGLAECEDIPNRAYDLLVAIENLRDEARVLLLNEIDFPDHCPEVGADPESPSQGLDPQVAQEWTGIDGRRIVGGRHEIEAAPAGLGLLGEHAEQPVDRGGFLRSAVENKEKKKKSV